MGKGKGLITMQGGTDKNMAKIKTAPINAGVTEPHQAVKGTREAGALMTFAAGPVANSSRQTTY